MVVLEGLHASKPIELRLRSLLIGLDLDVLVRRHDVDRHMLVVMACVSLAWKGILLLTLELRLNGCREGLLLAVAWVDQIIAKRLVSGCLIMNEWALLSIDEIVLLVLLFERLTLLCWLGVFMLLQLSSVITLT